MFSHTKLFVFAFSKSAFPIGLEMSKFPPRDLISLFSTKNLTFFYIRKRG